MIIREDINKMKKLKVIITIAMAFVMVWGFNPSTTYAKDNVSNTTPEEPILFNEPEISIEYREISREEFLENYALEHGISLEEADKIDREETQRAYLNESTNSRTNSLMTANSDYYETQYFEILKRFDTGYYADFWSQIVTSVQVKMHVYYRSTGTYQKFAEVIAFGASSYGSGRADFVPLAQSASITNNTEKGNSIIMLLSGNLNIEISSSLGFSAGAAGFEFQYSLGITEYWRKFIDTIRYTFDSNFPFQ